VIFKRHSELEGKHAIFSASKSAWLRYDDERLNEYVDNLHAASIGTRKHAVAAELIRLKLKQPNNRQTFNNYVNDAIGYNMTPEQPLYYSPWVFGTADAISFRVENFVDEETGEAFRAQVLRVFDLKTGVKPASGEQLVVYAALFCLEYNVKPFETVFDLRIYQNDEVVRIEVTPDEIVNIMNRAKEVSEMYQKRIDEEGV
jgi:hypothetical protein